MMKKYSHKKTAKEVHLNVKNYQRNSNMAANLVSNLRKKSKMSKAYNCHGGGPSFVSLKPLETRKKLKTFLAYEPGTDIDNVD